MSQKRKDHKGRILKTAESQRKDLIYQYRYADGKGVRRTICDADLQELCRNAKQIQAEMDDGIDYEAGQITAADYDQWDYLIGMDMSNIHRMLRIFGGDPEHKVHRLLDFTGKPADVSDPWYSDRFDICYRDVLAGCEALLRYIEGE